MSAVRQVIAALALLLVGTSVRPCNCDHASADRGVATRSAEHSCCAGRASGTNGPPAGESPSTGHAPDCTHCQAIDGKPASERPGLPVDGAAHAAPPSHPHSHVASPATVDDAFAALSPLAAGPPASRSRSSLLATICTLRI
jgi:hypothetical protein